MKSLVKALAAFLLFAMLVVADAQVPQPVTPGSASDMFSDKPYSINLSLIAALDPKPLKLEAFTPDSGPKVQGVRIISTGRVFPVVYEVISIPEIKSPDVLAAISKSLEEHSDIVLKERKTSEKLGDYLHYFQRVSVNGKPHHVSSNYLFVHGNTFYHLAASNYAAMIMPRSDWGPEKPDLNAENEAVWLLRAIDFK